MPDLRLGVTYYKTFHWRNLRQERLVSELYLVKKTHMQEVIQEKTISKIGVSWSYRIVDPTVIPTPRCLRTDLRQKNTEDKDKKVG